MLTSGSLLQHLAAALDAPEAQIIEMLIALQDAKLLPAHPDAALNTADLVTVVLALIANVDPSRVADEVLRLGNFRASGNFDRQDGPTFAICNWQNWPEQHETIREMLSTAIHRAGLPQDVTPLSLKFIRAHEGDRILFEARDNGNSVGIHFMGRYARCDAPARSNSALTASIENTLSWILITHLAEALIARPKHANDDSGPLLIERESAAVRPH